MDPFDPNLADAFRLYDIFDAAVGSLTDQYLTGCGMGFQPGRNVYLIADDGIVLVNIDIGMILHFQYGSDFPNFLS